MTITEAETTLDIETVEELDFTPTCQVREVITYAGIFTFPTTEPCGKPAKFMFNSHESPDCSSLQGYACEECVEQCRKDRCNKCGAPGATNIIPIH